MADNIMSSEGVKAALANYVNRNVQKTVNNLSYDKTIVATIQFCNDASIGQYKIKYHDGYYTAYAIDTNTIYSNGALVYVTVPKNDMNNRKVITGLVNNDNSLKTFITNLDGDQQFGVTSGNLISVRTGVTTLDMSSYEPKAMNSPSDGFIRKIYWTGYTNEENYLVINPSDVFNAVRNTAAEGNDVYLRFGATFRTEFLEYRKRNDGCDWGIRISLIFDGDNGGIKTYELNTSNIIGSPFELTSDSPRYVYFKIENPQDFLGIDSIEEYMFGFPPIDPGDSRTKDFDDIHIKDLSFQTAQKVYEYDNNKYNLKLIAERGLSLKGKPDDDNAVTELKLEAVLMVDGKTVNSQVQNLNFYWGIEDVSVNSVGHGKYNSALGLGWRCLNSWYLKKDESTQDPKDATKEAQSYEKMPAAGASIGWYSLNPAYFTKKILRAKQNVIKCVVMYENVPYEATITLYNENGKYILIKSTQGTQFYNGSGATNLVAGVFEDDTIITDSLTQKEVITPFPTQSDIGKYKFIWEEVKSSGVTNKIQPIDNLNLLLNDCTVEWGDGSKYENLINMSDEAELTYLNNNEDLITCIQRFNYYNKYLNSDDETIKTRAESRQNAIPPRRINNLKKYYTDTYTNDNGYYILGPSYLTAKHISGTNNKAGEIDTIDYYYYNETSGSDYDTYKTIENTLYNIKPFKILNFSTFKVTVIETEVDQGVTNEYLIGTESIRLVNSIGNQNYHLEIVNGDQNFVYSAGGTSPTSASDSTSTPIAVRPLHFILYKNDGSIVIDSSTVDTQEKEISLVDKFKPIWKFAIKDTMIKTNYSGSQNYHIELNDATMAYLEKSKEFVYNISDYFERDYVNRSNIILQVTYDGETVIASTNFVFAKQGDLGTNGTDKYLEIIDYVYDEYQNTDLNSPLFSDFAELDDAKKTKRFLPEQRHIKQGYLYANQCYDSNYNPTFLTRDNPAKFVNLKFAQSGGVNNNQFVVEGATEINLYGIWNDKGIKTPTDSSTIWTLPSQGAITPNDSYYIDSSFRFNTISSDPQQEEVGSTAHLGIPKPVDIPSTEDGLFYKPSPIPNFSFNGKTYTRIANNVITCEAKTEYGKGQDDLDKVIYRNFGYYSIPYFYYHHQSNGEIQEETDSIDPAKHFVVYGGYDTVIYDSTGHNPDYDRQTPFTFRLFDENHNDITKAVLADSQTHIDWDCSYGFKKDFSRCPTLAEIPDYNDDARLPINKDLIHTYCRYDNKIYKCIKNYKKKQRVRVRINNSTVTSEAIKVYEPGEFVEPYWELVYNMAGSEFVQTNTCDFIPNPTYDSIAYSSGYANWIRVEIYAVYNGNIYEAEAYIPINVICNKYGSDEINGWDGKRVKVGDATILASSVGAGEISDSHTFTGITIGKTMYEPDKSQRVGLFGYGTYKEQDANGGHHEQWGQTMFLDAKSGLAMFGPAGGTQIILNPNKEHIYQDNEYDWSRIAGWYFSTDFLYKPIGVGNYISKEGNYDEQIANGFAPPNDNIEGSAGMYVPFYSGSEDSSIYGVPKPFNSDTVFLWASCLTKDLQLIQELEAELIESKSELKAMYPALEFNGWNIVNRASVTELYYNQPIADWNSVIILLRRYKEDPTYEPRFVVIGDTEYVEFDVEVGTSDSSGSIDTGDTQGNTDDSGNNSSGSSSSSSGDSGSSGTTSDGQQATTVTRLLLKSIYDTEVFPYITQTPEEIQNQIEVDQGKLNTAVQNRRLFVTKCDNYEALVESYRHAVSDDAKNKGHATTYKDVQEKSSNFYVTYGGHLHASSADIEGKIVATSGCFGHDEGDKVQICIKKNNERYIFYNKNFWVKDTTTMSNLEDSPSVFMQGRILANSGQFGDTNPNLDGESDEVAFIQYSWYPWRKLKSYEIWCKDSDEDPVPPSTPGPEGTTQQYEDWIPHPDKTKPKNTKYLFYNPNFYIRQDGEVFLKGTIYGYAGRIGNWNMNTWQIWDAYDTIRLKPGTGPEERGYIQVGGVFIKDNGTIFHVPESDLSHYGQPKSRSYSIEDGRPYLKNDINALEAMADWAIRDGQFRSTVDGNTLDSGGSGVTTARTLQGSYSELYSSSGTTSCSVVCDNGELNISGKDGNLSLKSDGYWAWSGTAKALPNVLYGGRALTFEGYIREIIKSCHLVNGVSAGASGSGVESSWCNVSYYE